MDIRKLRRTKTWYGIAVFIALVISLGTMVVLARQIQDIRSRAATCNEQCPDSNNHLQNCHPPDSDGTPQESTCTSAGRMEICGGLNYCCPSPGARWTTNLTKCQICTPNAKTCDGTKLKTCNATGTKVTEQECAAGCSGNVCKICTPSVARCEGSYSKSCSADGTTQSNDYCSYGCNTSSGKCNVCRVGDVQCSSGVIKTCKNDGSGWNQTTCENGCNSSTKKCNVCKAYERRCSGGSAETCKYDGSGWTTLTCSSGCSNGTCNKCVPGEVSCQDSSLKTCNSAGTSSSTKYCSYGCNSARKQCNVCAPGASKCEGNTEMTCNSDGTAWITRTCSTGCSDGVCNNCTPNSKVCSGSTLKTCKYSGDGYDNQICQYGCDGVNKVCKSCVGGSSIKCTSACPTTCGQPAQTLYDCKDSCGFSASKQCPATAACKIASGAEGTGGTVASCTPVNGGWSNWSACTSSSCDYFGIQERTCTNPTFACGGVECEGDNQRTCVPETCGQVATSEGDLSRLIGSGGEVLEVPFVVTPTVVRVTASPSGSLSGRGIGFGGVLFYGFLSAGILGIMGYLGYYFLKNKRGF